MINEDILKDMVIRLKEIESSNNYEEVLNKINNINDKDYKYFKIQQENGFGFRGACNYKCKELEKEILSYLKGVC